MKICCVVFFALALVHSAYPKTIQKVWNDRHLLDYQATAAISKKLKEYWGTQIFLRTIIRELLKDNPDLVTPVNLKWFSIDNSFAPIDSRPRSEVIPSLKILVDPNEDGKEFVKCLHDPSDLGKSPVASDISQYKELNNPDTSDNTRVEIYREIRAKDDGELQKITAKANHCLVKILRKNLCAKKKLVKKAPEEVQQSDKTDAGEGNAAEGKPDEEEQNTIDKQWYWEYDTPENIPDELPASVQVLKTFIEEQLIPKLVEKKYAEITPSKTLEVYKSESVLIRDAFLSKKVGGTDEASDNENEANVDEKTVALKNILSKCFKDAMEKAEAKYFSDYTRCDTIEEDGKEEKLLMRLYKLASNSMAMAYFSDCRVEMEKTHTDVVNGSYTASELKAWEDFALENKD